jgi:hypothetical protein
MYKLYSCNIKSTNVEDYIFVNDNLFDLEL